MGTREGMRASFAKMISTASFTTMKRRKRRQMMRSVRPQEDKRRTTRAGLLKKLQTMVQLRH